MLKTTYTTPFTIFVFGATGDLAQKKLLPGLKILHEEQRLGIQYKIVCLGRSIMSTQEFHNLLKHNLPQENNTDDFLQHIFYHQITYSTPDELTPLIEEHQNKFGNNAPLLYYFALPSDMIERWAPLLCHNKETTEPRFLIEKPFGTSAQSALSLFNHLEQCLGDRLFLVDHFLCKSGVQSIYHLRHANPIMNALLSWNAIEKIMISAHEVERVEHRLGFYDKMGAIKDMVQSHLLQLVALLCMDLPPHGDIRLFTEAKTHVMDLLTIDETRPPLFGQYAGYGGQNKTTETYVHCTLKLQKQGWDHIPIILETGKGLTEKKTEIQIIYASEPQEGERKNTLTFTIAPEPALHLSLINHYNGFEDHTPVEVASIGSLSCHGDDCLPEHGRIILDALLGKKTSFSSKDEVLAGWRIVDQLEKQKKTTSLVVYDGKMVYTEKK